MVGKRIVVMGEKTYAFYDKQKIKDIKAPYSAPGFLAKIDDNIGFTLYGEYTFEPLACFEIREDSIKSIDAYINYIKQMEHGVLDFRRARDAESELVCPFERAKNHEEKMKQIEEVGKEVVE